MKSLLKWACAGLFAVGALFAQPAAAQTVDDIIKRGSVQIAVDPTRAPFGVTGPDGVDVDELVAKYLGVKLELVPVKSQNRIP